MFSSKLHKRVQSAGGATSTDPYLANGGGTDCILPPDHPHRREQRALGERGPNPGSMSKPGPYPSSRNNPTGGLGLHQKTKSVISLRSLLGEKDKTASPTKSTFEEFAKPKKSKKTRSSTNLAALFKRSNRDGKNSTPGKELDKENAALIEDAENMPPVQSPAWPQFESSPARHSVSSRYASSARRTLEEEVELYTPREYTPQSQRNFGNFQPSLTKRPECRSRPKSDLVSSNPFLVRDRLGSGNERGLNNQGGLTAKATAGRSSSNEHPASRRSRRDSGVTKTSRVLAAITNFGSKDKEKGKEKEKRSEISTKALPKEIDKAFEDLLVRQKALVDFANSMLTRFSFRTRETFHIICATKCGLWIQLSRPTSSRSIMLGRSPQVHQLPIQILVDVKVHETATKTSPTSSLPPAMITVDLIEAGNPDPEVAPLCCQKSLLHHARTPGQTVSIPTSDRDRGMYPGRPQKVRRNRMRRQTHLTLSTT